MSLRLMPLLLQGLGTMAFTHQVQLMITSQSLYELMSRPLSPPDAIYTAARNAAPDWFPCAVIKSTSPRYPAEWLPGAHGDIGRSTQ